MKKILLFLSIAVLASCTEPCTPCVYKFDIGQNVHIKNKPSHSMAVITKQIQTGDCDCYYEIAYFSTFNTRRHRTVTAGEIEATDGNMFTDEAKTTLKDEIKNLLNE